jgi:hypothetical protein
MLTRIINTPTTSIILFVGSFLAISAARGAATIPPGLPPQVLFSPLSPYPA